MNNWTEIALLDDIPRLGSRILKTDTVDIAIFRTSNDQVFAVRDECPHRKGPLSQGLVHDMTVTCPLHNWKIDLRTGEAQAPDKGCTHTYPIKVEKGRIFISYRISAAA